MATYTQSERPLQITTPLGKDVLLLTSIKGRESISQLFHFDLELHAEVGSVVKFEKILGRPVTIRMDLTNGNVRHFNGLVSKFSQAGRSDLGFGKFRAQVVPAFWTLTRKVRCRTFQHLSIPEILRLVLVGFDVSFRLIGTYPPRDYCVQYRESDFDFASRLMEEEGISYYFQHADGSHTMIVSDRLSLPVEGQTSVVYDSDEGAVSTDMRVTEWEKSQTLLSGEFTFWDHCFELPGNHLEAKKKLTETIVVGTVPHKLRLPANETWEVYDYPGAYARRFDGIDSAGTPQPTGIQHIFEDRSRAIQIRMQQEETASLDIRGESYCGNFSAGFKFQLKRHFDADGEYFLTSVEHTAKLEDHQTGEVAAFTYNNSFHCIPATMNFRPEPVTKKPVIAGIQTATVVGPPGEQIFVDMYGRVKVQFHWDREGKHDSSSSCWLRVSQVWAGKGWGAFFWPRIGHEVVVVFEDGDPDQPIVVGSVYNRENMPFFDLPLCKDFAGVKSESTRGNAHEHYNGIVMVDRKGEEHLHIHSERHMIFNTEFDRRFYSGRHQGERVPGHKITTVGGMPGKGGGSGGDPDDDIWQRPTEQAFAGVNATSVYGMNFQNAAPINFQVAMPSNLQFCINPSAISNALGIDSPVDGPMAAVLGSGLAGNLQVTLGNSTNLVIGQSYDINLGPGRLVVDVHSINKYNLASKLMTLLMLAFNIVYEIGYLALEHDDARTILTVLYTLLTEAAVSVLLQAQSLTHDVDNHTRDIINQLFAHNQSLTGWSDISQLYPEYQPSAPVGDGTLAFTGAWGGLMAGVAVIGAGLSDAEPALQIKDNQDQALKDTEKRAGIDPSDPPDPNDVTPLPGA